MCEQVASGVTIGQRGGEYYDETAVWCPHRWQLGHAKIFANGAGSATKPNKMVFFALFLLHQKIFFRVKISNLSNLEEFPDGVLAISTKPGAAAIYTTIDSINTFFSEPTVSI